LIQIDNNTYIIGFYLVYACKLYFTEARLEINFNNRIHTKRLANLYFSTSFLTCHKSNQVDEQMV